MDLIKVLRDLSNYLYRRHNTETDAEKAQMLYGYATAAGESAVRMEFLEYVWSVIEEKTPETARKLERIWISKYKKQKGSNHGTTDTGR